MTKRLLFVAIAAAIAVSAFAVPVSVGNPGFPYSVPGSFLTVSRQEKGKYHFGSVSGLWIRNVSTAWREDVCRLVPSVGGTDVEVTECVMREGWLEARTAKGAIEFAYLRPDGTTHSGRIPKVSRMRGRHEGEALRKQTHERNEQ